MLFVCRGFAKNNTNIIDKILHFHVSISVFRYCGITVVMKLHAKTKLLKNQAPIIPFLIFIKPMDSLPANLNYTDPQKPGISRKKRGKGVMYVFENGKPVTAKKTLDRISKLVIPPMWRNVWINKDPKGHI